MQGSSRRRERAKEVVEPSRQPSTTMATSEVVRTLFVTLRKSFARRPERTRRVVKSLGLKKIDSVKELPNNASVRGAIDRVSSSESDDTARNFSLC